MTRVFKKTYPLTSLLKIGLLVAAFMGLSNSAQAAGITGAIRFLEIDNMVERGTALLAGGSISDQAFKGFLNEAVALRIVEKGEKHNFTLERNNILVQTYYLKDIEKNPRNNIIYIPEGPLTSENKKWIVMRMTAACKTLKEELSDANGNPLTGQALEKAYQDKIVTNYPAFQAKIKTEINKLPS